MARNKGTAGVGFDFQVKAALPLDSRTRVENLTDLTSAATWTTDGNLYIYEGMQVYVIANKKKYTLTDPANYDKMTAWREEGSGGSSASGEDFIINLSSLPSMYDMVDAFQSTKTVIVRAASGPSGYQPATKYIFDQLDPSDPNSDYSMKIICLRDTEYIEHSFSCEAVNFTDTVTYNGATSHPYGGSSGTLSGWGIAKTGTVTGTFSGDWLQGATVDISDLNLSSVNDYDVYVRGDSVGSAFVLPYINSGRTTTSFQVAANKNGQSISEFTASYVVIAKGFGSSGNDDIHHVELTQAEYDALTEEEKTNGTIYFITDGVAGQYNGWGIAKVGSVTLTSTGGSHIPSETIDITDLGLASVNDYEVLTTLEGDRSTNYRVQEAFAQKISEAQCAVGFYTTKEDGLTTNVTYIIVAKGYANASVSGGSGGASGLSGLGIIVREGNPTHSQYEYNDAEVGQLYAQTLAGEVMQYLVCYRKNASGMCFWKSLSDFIQISVDSALSTTSVRPVQNKVITAAIGDIETILQTLNTGGGA